MITDRASRDSPGVCWADARSGCTRHTCRDKWRYYSARNRQRKAIFILQLFQFSRSVVSDSLRPRGLQHARPPCPSPTPGVHPNSCPSSRWCHPTISSSVAPFSSRLQSFPASGSFPVSQLFASGGQSAGASASATATQPSNRPCTVEPLLGGPQEQACVPGSFPCKAQQFFYVPGSSPPSTVPAWVGNSVSMA